MKKPNFFIMGAPKCGTTSMAAWLGGHPQIFISDPKELYFFSSDFAIKTGVKTLEHYLRIFQNAGDQHLAVGEASVSYLLSHVAAKNILEFNPAAKFIVMLRNPIDMAPSWHSQIIMTPGMGRIHDDFEADWKAKLARKRKRGKLDFLYSWDPALLQYDTVCKLGEQVQRLLQTVDVKSVLFIVLDDLANDPLHEYRRVLEFLDVPYDGKTDFTRYNQAKRPQYKLVQNMFTVVSIVRQLVGFELELGLFKKIHQCNEKPYKAPPLRSEFKQELIEFFKEDVKQLSSLLDRDFSHWLR